LIKAPRINTKTNIIKVLCWLVSILIKNEGIRNKGVRPVIKGKRVWLKKPICKEVVYELACKIA